MRLAGAPLLVALLVTTASSCRAADDPVVLTVFSAASAGPALRAVARDLPAAGVAEVRVELSGSQAAVHKLTEQGRVPDLLVSADLRLLEPLAARDLVGPVEAFASNRLVLAFNPRTPGGRALAAGEPWQRVLVRDDVRLGLANPALAPVGYRALLALALNDLTAPADLRLGARIKERVQRRDLRPDVTKLIAPLETGEVDAAFVYASEAHNARLPFVELDDRVSFADPALDDTYARASIDPDDDGPAPAVRGAAAVYGLAVPTAARHKDAARAFVARLRSDAGRALAAASGLTVHPTTP